MMNTFKFCLLFLAIIGIVGLNFSKNRTSQNVFTDISLKNVNSLQASAAEATCAPITQNQCIIDAGGITVHGYGQPIVVY